MVDRARQWTKACAVGVHVVVHGRGQVGATVVAVVQHGHFGAAGVFAGDFDGVFHCFSARVDEHALLGEGTWGVLGEEFRGADVGLVADEAKEGVGDFADLLAHGVNDSVVGVAGSRYTDTPGEIDEVVTVHVHEDSIVCVIGVNREELADTLGNHLGAAIVQLDRVGARQIGHDLALLGNYGVRLG